MKTKGNDKKGKVNVVTLGCSKNMVDSEVLMQQLRGNDMEVTHEKNAESNDTVIVNTCGFIDLAKQESIDTILHYADLKIKGGIEKLFVTGCLSERYRTELQAEIPEVDDWFGTLELPFLLEKLGADYKHELLGERGSIITPQHYAYLKISEGCNRKCSFCAIPIMRGKHVSKPIEEITKEARNLVKNGAKEIMLIAQELTYYGLDIYRRRALANLLNRLADVEGLEWIRLHYAYPHQFPLEILDVMRERPNICNYLDMPLQHISDKMLQRMNRFISKQQTIDLISAIRERVPDIAIRTTMLVGFPGETDDDIAELAEFIEQQRFERLGIFQYSHEDDTAATEYEDNVPDEEKANRMAYLMNLQQQVSHELNLEKIGRTYKTLFDRYEDGNFIGRTQYDSPEVDNEVIVAAGDNSYLRIGDFANIRITDADAFDLFGEAESRE